MNLDLNFKSNDFENKALKFVGETLANLGKLKILALNFSKNKISKEGIAFLTIGFEKLLNLENLELDFK